MHSWSDFTLPWLVSKIGQWHTRGEVVSGARDGQDCNVSFVAGPEMTGTETHRVSLHGVDVA